MFDTNEITLDESEEAFSNPKMKKAPENNLIVKSLNEPNSRRKAIHAHCFTCIGGTESSFPDPGWRSEIRECKVHDCCLWQFRPFQKNNAQ
jgi:hypothetical protein